MLRRGDEITNYLGGYQKDTICFQALGGRFEVQIRRFIYIDVHDRQELFLLIFRMQMSGSSFLSCWRCSELSRRSLSHESVHGDFHLDLLTILLPIAHSCHVC